LLTARRRNHELHVATLDVEHCVRCVPLRIDSLPVLVLPSRLLRADPFEEVPGIESEPMSTHTSYLWRPDLATGLRHPGERPAAGLAALRGL
jgi:hypothetical protein